MERSHSLATLPATKTRRLALGRSIAVPTGSDNTAHGFQALYSNTIGIQNTVNGAFALYSNTIGDYNTANGASALFSNTTGMSNTAVGLDALYGNTTGSENAANGLDALYSNTTGFGNTANGSHALYSNTTADYNTATGVDALYSTTTGFDNTASGAAALYGNTTGSDNTAHGYNALFNNTTGAQNTANGSYALHSNTTGSSNTALGNGAGLNATGSNNVYLGADMQGVAGENDACYIKSIFGQTSVAGIPVLINSNNKLGIATSSKRFKDDIKPMDKASEGVLALKPVTFRYKKGIDPQGIPQFGLVAEDVEKVNPDLVLHDKKGKPYTVRYDQVNAMLLNEFLKEHRKVEQLEANATRQQQQMEALTVGLRKVSAQLEASKPAPQVVNNP